MTGEDNTRFSPFKEFNTSVSDWFTNFSLVDFEESIAGKSGARFLDENSNKIVSYITIGLAVILGLFGSSEFFTIDGLLAMLDSTTDQVLTDGRTVTFSESALYSGISALALIGTALFSSYSQYHYILKAISKLYPKGIRHRNQNMLRNRNQNQMGK